MLIAEPAFELTVVLTVVSGKKSVQDNLEALIPQIDFEKAEIIVPYDRWCADVGELASAYSSVKFTFIESPDVTTSIGNTADEHRLFDKRRAVGLELSQGNIIAMTEDHARPAADWIRQILVAHAQPYDVIGGAVENGIEKPVNRALYYCDFGRYGRPFRNSEASYLSDVNIAYKREALVSVRDAWVDAYHETTVHWALKRNGKTLFLDNRPVVYQTRNDITLIKALHERIGWGRIFAETRVREITVLRRFLFASGALLLPGPMLGRVFRHMLRQDRSIRIICSTLPVALLLLMVWSWGEFIGYILGEPRKRQTETERVRTHSEFSAPSHELKNKL